MDLNAGSTPLPSAHAVARAFIHKQLKRTHTSTTELLQDDSETTQHKAVHELRVGARRMRVAVSVFRELLPRKLRKRLDRRFHKLQDAAARVRDLDVWRVELERLQRGRRYKLAVAFALAKAGTERQSYGQKLKKKAIVMRQLDLWRWAKRKVTKALAEPEAAAGEQGAQQATLFTEMAGELLAKRLKAFEKAFKHAESNAPNDLHQARIAAKKVRYTVEIFKAAFAPEAVSKTLKSMKTLQDSLGQLCDCVVFAGISGRLAFDAEADAETRASLDLLAHHYHKLVGQKTRDFRASWEEQGPDGPLAMLRALTPQTVVSETDIETEPKHKSEAETELQNTHATRPLDTALPLDEPEAAAPLH